MVRLSRHRNLVLLLLLLAAQVALPLAAQESRLAQFGFDVLFSAVVIMTLFVVFPGARSRLAAFALLAPALLLVGGEYWLGTLGRPHASLVYHLSAALFSAAAVLAIVRHIFRGRDVTTDEVVGAFVGYLMLGILWGNLFAAVAIVDPAAFSVSPAIRWQLDDWYLRRALFNYLSLATLSSLGYSDVTPTSPLSNTLTWMEVMAAQFYMAVVVAQIVGLKLAQALAGPRQDAG